MRLIDADALINRLDVVDYGMKLPKAVVGLTKALLEDAPTIDIDRPQGEWVDAEIPLESGDTMPIQVCNLCKTFYPLAYTGGGHRFCPNCGARMLKGAEAEG